MEVFRQGHTVTAHLSLHFFLETQPSCHTITTILVNGEMMRLLKLLAAEGVRYLWTEYVRQFYYVIPLKQRYLSCMCLRPYLKLIQSTWKTLLGPSLFTPKNTQHSPNEMPPEADPPLITSAG
jgi:hypothetical protein